MNTLYVNYSSTKKKRMRYVCINLKTIFGNLSDIGENTLDKRVGLCSVMWPKKMANQANFALKNVYLQANLDNQT